MGLAMLVPLVAVVILAIGFAFRSPRSLERKLTVTLLNVAWLLVFLLFAYPPDLPNVSRDAVLITPGFKDAEFDNFQTDKVFVHGDVTRNIKSTPITDIGVLNRHYPEINKLRVLGGGLYRDQWLSLQATEIDFQPSELPLGFVRIDWNREIYLGDTLKIKGLVTNVDASTQISLVSPFGDILQTIPVSQSGSFVFETVPKTTGRHLYGLELSQELEKKDELIPIMVEQPSQTKIEIRTGAPNFEVNYLKRWAEKTGSAIQLKTKVSKDRYRNEWINSRFDLAETNILIMDMRSWQETTQTEKNSVLERVNQSAMGLLLMGGELSEPIKIVDELNLLPAEVRAVDYAIENTNIALSTGAIGYAQQLPNNRLIETGPLSQQTQYTKYGRGKIGITLIVNSYLLATHGYQTAHGHYWQQLLSGLLSSNMANERFVGTSDKSYVHRRTPLCFETDNTAVRIKHDSYKVTVKLEPHRIRKDIKCGYFWPQRIGWYDLETVHGRYNLYVFGTSAFLAEQQHTRTQATTAFANNLKSVKPNESYASHDNAPRIWFFVPLLIIAAVLWWEQKTRPE